MRLTKPAWVTHSGESSRPFVQVPRQADAKYGYTDSKKKRNPLFGLHVHPDCSRLATGGIGQSVLGLEIAVDPCPEHISTILHRSDAKIRIWSTLPILSKAAEENEANPKLLCTLSNHNGKRSDICLALPS